MHPRTLLIAATALCTLACQRAEPAREEIPAPVSSCWAESAGAARVRVSDEMAARLGEGAEDPETGRWERLFPDAGVYEPRTRRAGLHRWYKVEPAAGPVTRAFEAQLSEMDGVEKVEAAPPVAMTADYDDPYMDRLWGLSNPSGPDINCMRVWDEFTCGDPRVIVAVIDGGIDLSHPDLAANCLPAGHYNYVDDNETIVPHIHGTHVAGIIAAARNNGIGTAGVAGGNAAEGRRGVSLLSCQIFKTVEKDGKSVDESGTIERAIKEAADKGAVICQNSWGYLADANGDGVVTDSEQAAIERYFANTPEAMRDAIDYFVANAGCDNDGNQLPDSPMKGGIVLFASGNEGMHYGAPANYAPVVAVGAIDSDGSRPDFSNYGDWVDICAPGVGITSTVPDGKYGKLRGTSTACPHVAGVAALLVSYFGGPGFTCDELKERLLGGADARISATQIGPLVDAYGAFMYDGLSPYERNQPPRIVQAPSPVRLVGLGERTSFDLTALIQDPDDATLQYGIQNDSPSLLHTLLKDGQLTVTAVGFGAGTLEVTATDALGKSCTLVLKFLARSAEEAFDLYPADGVVRYLTVRTGLLPAETRIRILDYFGGAVYDDTLSFSAFDPAVIDLAALAPGRYTIVLEWDGEISHKSFVKR